jgi:hypothetical protein
MFEKLDKRTSILAEGIARSLSRRQVLVTTVKGTVATVAAATLGILVDLKTAFAITCDCHWYDGIVGCPNYGACNSGGPGACPSGCSYCTSADVCRDSKGYYCGYSDGWWVSCTGFGQCGNGYKICSDCKCTTCSYVCTCLSNVICSGCCTPQQVEAEMRRLMAGASAAVAL